MKYDNLFKARRQWAKENPSYPLDGNSETWPKAEDFGYTEEEVALYLKKIRNKAKKNIDHNMYL